MSFDKIFEYAVSIGCKAEREVPMSKYTTFRIGGNASVMLTPLNDGQLTLIIKKCKKENIKPFILGNGSNMLICDAGLKTVVINMCRPEPEIKLVNGDTIVCDAGMTMSKVCNFALENGLTGLEFAFGIPGSAGGAAYMNAGAYGGEMKQIVESVTVLTMGGEEKMLSGEESAFAYRTSVYQTLPCVIVKAVLRLQPGDPETIGQTMRTLIEKRKASQPLELPSAGSTFKRPTGYFAGPLIEQAGLKGCGVGGAEVSKKHAGFIVNTGGATAEDIKKTIAMVQSRVWETSGVRLEPEVRIW